MEDLVIGADIREHQLYNPRNFVNRDDEQKMVAERVQQGRKGAKISQPLINFWGAPGLGKSWLLRYLQDLYRFQPGSLTSNKGATFTALFDFREVSNHLPVMARLARELAKQILIQLGDAAGRDAQSDLEQIIEATETSALTEQAVSAFTNAINLLSQTFVPILLFDSVELAVESVRDELELRIIEPVLWNDHVIVIVAGRRQIPRWKRFEVRRRATDSAKTGVAPFDKGHVRSQLDKWGLPALTDDVYALTYGHPHTTDLLGQILQQVAVKQAVDSQYLIQHKQELGSFLAEIENYLLEGLSSEIRLPLELISPLRYFRIDPLRRFMVAFLDAEYETRPDSYYLKDVIGAMEATNLVWWSREHRAYELSRVVRRMINRRLNLTDPVRYAQLHEKALSLYLGWIAEFPQNASVFIIEAIFHLAMLYKDTEPEKLIQGIDARLQNAEELTSEEANTLYEQLRSDHELEDLLAPEEYQRLLSMCSNLRDKKSQAPAH